MSTGLLCLASFIVGAGVSFVVNAFMSHGVEELYFEELGRSNLLRNELHRMQREQKLDAMIDSDGGGE